MTLLQVKNCTEHIDLITQESWSTSPPDLFISFDDRLHCYHKDTLKQWLDNKENTFALWTYTDPAKALDASGFGGSPNVLFKYYKLYTQEFVALDREFYVPLTNPLPQYLVMRNNGVKRLGNLHGTFGPSQLHGQAPGYLTYVLKDVYFLQPHPDGFIIDDKTSSEMLNELLINKSSLEVRVALIRKIEVSVTDAEKWLTLWRRDISIHFPRDTSTIPGNYYYISADVIMELNNPDNALQILIKHGFEKLLQELLARPLIAEQTKENFLEYYQIANNSVMQTLENFMFPTTWHLDLWDPALAAEEKIFWQAKFLKNYRKRLPPVTTGKSYRPAYMMRAGNLLEELMKGWNIGKILTDLPIAHFHYNLFQNPELAEKHKGKHVPDLPADKMIEVQLIERSGLIRKNVRLHYATVQNFLVELRDAIVEINGTEVLTLSYPHFEENIFYFDLMKLQRSTLRFGEMERDIHIGDQLIGRVMRDDVPVIYDISELSIHRSFHRNYTD